MVRGRGAIAAVLPVSPALQESRTWDEAVEIAGGYRYLNTGENRFFIEHPPLGRILVALPLRRNRLVGGPAMGPKYLVDSNLDWGQDLGNLKCYMDRHGTGKIGLSRHGRSRLLHCSRVCTCPMTGTHGCAVRRRPRE